MTDRDQWNVRGVVKTCRLERTWHFFECGGDACDRKESGDSSVVEFRSDGALLRHLHKNPDGSEWNTTYTYGDDGRLLAMQSGNTAGVSFPQAYEYGAGDRLTRVIVRDREGRQRVAETYTYDGVGRKTKTLHVDLDSQRPDTHYGWGVEGTDACYSAPGAASVTTVYDEHERPRELLFRDATGELLSRVDFVYDAAGNLVEEAQSNCERVLPAEMLGQFNADQLRAVRSLFGAGEEPNRRTHKYDERGCRIESCARLGGLAVDRTTSSYNEYGDKIAENSEHEDREYGLSESGELSAEPVRRNSSRGEHRIGYDYDERDNWVRKTTESRGGSQPDFTVTSIERRTLIYFDIT